jgi:hypothetical protein
VNSLCRPRPSGGRPSRPPPEGASRFLAFSPLGCVTSRRVDDHFAVEVREAGQANERVTSISSN